MVIRAIASLLVAIALRPAGCQLAPYDQQVYDSESAITFYGFAAFPNSRIDIQGCENQDVFLTPFCVPDFSNPDKPIQFVTLATVTASSTAGYTDSLGYPWYFWKTTIAIPSNYWHNNGPLPPSPTSPAAATVRVIENGRPTHYYDSDPSACPEPYGTAQFDTHDPRCAFDGNELSFNAGVIVLAKGY